MKQIQYATVQVAQGPEFNPELRAQLEGPLNKGWNLDSWQAFDARDANNQPIYNVLVCLTRDTDAAVDKESPQEAKKSTKKNA